MVSSTGATSTPSWRNTHMSYLMFWPTLRTDGSSSSGFSLAIAFLSGIWPGSRSPASLAPPSPERSSAPCASAPGLRWLSGR